ncbi:MAG: metallophosphoesterase [Clostridia bacterium]|nr:metallophosphoesterase [Clostridia bacterium]
MSKVKVGIFADPHSSLNIISTKTRRPSLSIGKIKRIMDIFKAEGVEYVICLGDLIDDCGGEEQTGEMIKIIMDLVRSYGVTFHAIYGNHDCHNFPKEKFVELAQVNAEPFTARVGDALFVFLDANYYDDGSTYEPGHTLWTNSYITQDQLDFYADAWQNTDAKEVYVFLHENLDTNITNQKYWIKNAEQVRSALAECPKLRGVYQGHYHNGITSVFDDVPYITVPAVCEGENMPYIILEV